MAKLIQQGMHLAGFAIVHVQSPCTTYNDTYEELKGDVKKGIEPALWEIPEDHDPEDKAMAHDLLQRGGVPVGIIYKDESRPSLDQRLEELSAKARPKTVEQLMAAFEF